MSEDDQERSDSPVAEDPGRRRALGALVVVGSVVYGGALAVPACRFAVPPAGAAASERWVRVSKSDALPEGGPPLRAQVIGDEKDAFTIARDQQLGSVWLQRKSGKIVALSAECPHLGCSIDLGEDEKAFGCPCHASRFELGGEVSSGPSPRAMDALETREQDGFVEVAFRRFRQGVPDKVPA